MSVTRMEQGHSNSNDSSNDGSSDSSSSATMNSNTNGAVLSILCTGDSSVEDTSEDIDEEEVGRSDRLVAFLLRKMNGTWSQGKA